MLFQEFMTTKHEKENICDDECTFVILQMKTITVNTNTKQGRQTFLCIMRSFHLPLSCTLQLIYIFSGRNNIAYSSTTAQA